MKIDRISYSADGAGMVIACGDDEYRLLPCDWDRMQGGLSVGEELSEDAALELTFCSEKHSAVKKGLAKLAFTARSPKELCELLMKSGLGKEASKAAVLYLCEKGQIDQAGDCARRIGSQLSKGRGPVRIRFELKQKGYSDKVIERALAPFEEELEPHFEKTFESAISRFGAQREKVYQYLLRQGWESERITEKLRLFRASL